MFAKTSWEISASGRSFTLLLLFEIELLTGVVWKDEGSEQTGVQAEGGWIFLCNIWVAAEAPKAGGANMVVAAAAELG